MAEKKSYDENKLALTVAKGQLTKSFRTHPLIANLGVIIPILSYGNPT